MKGITLIGVLLIVLGLAGLVWPVITYTDTETLVDIGPVEVTSRKQERIPIPPIAGGAAVVAGVVLVAMGKKRQPS